MDKRALKILFDAYWSGARWKNEEDFGATAEDFSYARAAGLMFDPITLDHDAQVRQLTGLIRGANVRVVADAFLASLSTRRLDWRSALGSFAVFQHLTEHAPLKKERRCVICGVYLKPGPIDRNVLSFERWKWGGVRHDQVEYAAFDLEAFLAGKPPEPSADDREVFHNLIHTLRAVDAKVTGASVQKQLAPLLKSNKEERDRIVAILGFCGILATPNHPGYATAFVPERDRDLPDQHFGDMDYPACWWTGQNGVNDAALQAFFGHVL